MRTVTRTPIIRMGDAATIRIPQVWLDRLTPDHEVEIVMEDDQLIIRPVHRPDAVYQPLTKASQRVAPKPSAAITHLEDDDWDV